MPTAQPQLAPDSFLDTVVTDQRRPELFVRDLVSHSRWQAGPEQISDFARAFQNPRTGRLQAPPEQALELAHVCRVLVQRQCRDQLRR
jgi:hypothetical protein